MSIGTWSVNEAEGYGIFNGTVKDVPSLSAPGFLSAYADGHFNDVSNAISGELVLKVQSSTPEYTGFRGSFAAGTLSPMYSCAGGGTIPFSGGCFKAKFSVPAGDDFVEVHLPFSSFSDHWDPKTGDQITTCAEDSGVCPTKNNLAHIKRMEIWAEGVGGNIHIKVQSIFAIATQFSVQLASSLPTQVPLVTFDGADTTTFEFRQMNDPVMV